MNDAPWDADETEKTWHPNRKVDPYLKLETRSSSSSFLDR